MAQWNEKDDGIDWQEYEGMFDPFTYHDPPAGPPVAHYRVRQVAALAAGLTVGYIIVKWVAPMIAGWLR
jgi:hypothetical protein